MIITALIHHAINPFSEASAVLQSKYENSVKNLILSASESAQNLLTRLTSDFECFNDSTEFDVNHRVSFFKRAQIFISDLWCLFEGQGLGKFDDIDSLTMFADYRVPQSLQYFGAFKYSEVSTITSFHKATHEIIYLRVCRNCSNV